MAPLEVHQPEVARLTALVLALLFVVPVVRAGWSAVLAGALAEGWGYRTSLGLAIAGVALALLLSMHIRPVQAESTTASDSRRR